MRQFSINRARQMRYNTRMSQSAQPVARPRLAVIAVGILLFAIASGAVFAMWVSNGPQILMTLGSSALAWCF